MYGAVGGAIAGAGVDLGLLLVGSMGTAAPVVLGAAAIAYTAGGLGNVYMTYASSHGTVTGNQLLGSFIIGGTFNALSFGTGFGASANTLGGIVANGMSNLGNNAISGTLTAVSTSVATEIGISTRKSTAQQKVSVPIVQHGVISKVTGDNTAWRTRRVSIAQVK